MNLFGLTTSESAHSPPAAAWQSCFSTLMNLPPGTSSCLNSDQSEQPAQVSPARRTSRGSSAWFTSSRWVERFGGKRSAAHRGLPDSRPARGPPRWSVDEMTGRILILAPRGRGNRAGAGWRRMEVAGFTSFWSLLCWSAWRCAETSSYTPLFTFNTSTVLNWAVERLALEGYIFYKGILVEYDTRKSAAESQGQRRRETTSVMDDREISIWAGRETSNYEKRARAPSSRGGLSESRPHELNSVVRS